MKPAATNAILAIDIGNTAIKLALFSIAADALSPESNADQPRDVQLVGEVLKLRSQQQLAVDVLSAWWPTVPTEVYIASVCAPARIQMADWIRHTHAACPIHIMTRRDFPIAIAPDLPHPERIGHDRLAASVCAAKLKSPSRPAIVVDAGSAVKVDLVSAAGQFCGGAILPGWQMMANSLQQATDQLPRLADLKMDRSPPVVGKDTEAAIASGIYWGLVGSIRCLIQEMAAECDVLPEIILAGGDMSSLAPVLKQVHDRGAAAETTSPLDGSLDGPLYGSMQAVSNLVVRGIAISAHQLRKRSGVRPDSADKADATGSA